MDHRKIEREWLNEEKRKRYDVACIYVSFPTLEIIFFSLQWFTFCMLCIINNICYWYSTDFKQIKCGNGWNQWKWFVFWICFKYRTVNLKWIKCERSVSLILKEIMNNTNNWWNFVKFFIYFYIILVVNFVRFFKNRILIIYIDNLFKMV